MTKTSWRFQSSETTISPKLIGFLSKLESEHETATGSWQTWCPAVSPGPTQHRVSLGCGRTKLNAVVWSSLLRGNRCLPSNRLWWLTSSRATTWGETLTYNNHYRSDCLGSGNEQKRLRCGDQLWLAFIFSDIPLEYCKLYDHILHHHMK